MKKYKKSSYSKLVRDLIDSDYKEVPVKDCDGKVVEGLKLSKEDKAFMYEFENSYYGNNHRKSEIFTSHPDYEKRIKKEMDDSNNSRMRDLLALNRYDKRMITDLTNIANPEYSNNELTDRLAQDGFETTVSDLIDSALINLDGFSIKSNHDMDDGKKILSDLTIDIVRVIKMEMAAERASKKRDK